MGCLSMNLYHISEDSDIKIFEPRPSNDSWPNLKKSYVWAVSGEMIHNYYFPRNCPRVCWMIGPDTTEEEREIFRSYGSYRSIIHVEKRWKENIENTILYRYTFNIANFYPVDYSAGYYVSEEREEPINKVKICDSISCLNQAEVLLKYVDDLRRYQELSVEYTYRFSNIRMRCVNEEV